jgi:hypothetical protein
MERLGGEEIGRRASIRQVAFAKVKELGAESRVPLLEVLRNYPVAALLAIGVVLVNIGGYYIVITFTLSYVTEQLGVASNVPLIGLLLAGLAGMLGGALAPIIATERYRVEIHDERGLTGERV